MNIGSIWFGYANYTSIILTYRICIDKADQLTNDIINATGSYPARNYFNFLEQSGEIVWQSDTAIEELGNKLIS